MSEPERFRIEIPGTLIHTAWSEAREGLRVLLARTLAEVADEVSAGAPPEPDLEDVLL